MSVDLQWGITGEVSATGSGCPTHGGTGPGYDSWEVYSPAGTLLGYNYNPPFVGHGWDVGYGGGVLQVTVPSSPDAAPDGVRYTARILDSQVSDPPACYLGVFNIGSGSFEQPPGPGTSCGS